MQIAPHKLMPRRYGPGVLVGRHRLDEQHNNGARRCPGSGNERQEWPERIRGRRGRRAWD